MFERKIFLPRFLKKMAYKHVITKPNQTIPMLPWLPWLPRENETHLNGFFLDSLVALVALVALGALVGLVA